MLPQDYPLLIKENSFCDVTLVSDDQIRFQAHRYVLSTFSPVLKNIFLNNPHSHPLIYLNLKVYLPWKYFSKPKQYEEIYSCC